MIIMRALDTHKLFLRKWRWLQNIHDCETLQIVTIHRLLYPHLFKHSNVERILLKILLHTGKYRISPSKTFLFLFLFQYFYIVQRISNVKRLGVNRFLNYRMLENVAIPRHYDYSGKKMYYFSLKCTEHERNYTVPSKAFWLPNKYLHNRHG